MDRHSRHQWRWVTRPGRAWKWRLRTGAIELLDAAAEQGLLEEVPDVIFVTSMVSVGDLRALLPPSLRACPIVLYMHENQAAYPFRHTSETEVQRDHQFALTNLTSILSADAVLWNSQWNQDSFCRAIESLLRKAPDGTVVDVTNRIASRSRVAWPPIERPPVDAAGSRVLHNSEPVGGLRQDGTSGGAPVRIAWPHRWEHDKGPDTLLRLARFLEHTSPGRYRWTLLGEQFGKIPESLVQFQREFSGQIDHAGWVESREAYWGHLSQCTWVLSTARHEFFGVAVVEAMLAGCLPWLPRRLSYPEITPVVAHGLSPGNEAVDLAQAQRRIMEHLEATDPAVATGLIDSVLDTVAQGQNPA
ncbi:MAG: DUF3524 domain-containing protein [Phycisphaerales bacterium]|nr:DUF3524 domain-containing protein [Phycisphaerales bacterium]